MESIGTTLRNNMYPKMQYWVHVTANMYPKWCFWIRDQRVRGQVLIHLTKAITITKDLGGTAGGGE